MTISVKVIADSVSSVNGKRITTLEVEFPRFILSEWNTHRLFSRNAASTRAIPILKQLELISQSPAMPVFYGKNQSGMVAKEEVDQETKEKCEQIIKNMLAQVSEGVSELNKLGLHKQHSGRYLEPWMHVKGVITSTEFDNFFWLRKHPSAQPEIKLLAEKMWDALKASEPVTLKPGDWHTPYFGAGYWLKDCGVPLEDALAISSSCCAQVSYRKLDDSLEKANDVFDKLIESKPCHASPTEHQATPMSLPVWTEQGYKLDLSWDEGTTHCDKFNNLWSGNLKGWIQHRQLIKDNVCWEYSDDVLCGGDDEK